MNFLCHCPHYDLSIPSLSRETSFHPQQFPSYFGGLLVCTVVWICVVCFCVSVCVQVQIYVHLYVCVFVCVVVWIYMWVCVYECVRICTFVWVNGSMWECVYVVCEYEYLDVYVCVWGMSVCIYLCKYVCALQSLNILVVMSIGDDVFTVTLAITSYPIEEDHTLFFQKPMIGNSLSAVLNSSEPSSVHGETIYFWPHFCRSPADYHRYNEVKFLNGVPLENIYLNFMVG